MVRKKKACKCLQVISLFAFVMFLFIFSLVSLSDKQVTNMVKNYIFRLVEVNEEQLSCLAGKYAQENHSFMIHQYQRGENKVTYKKVKDKEVSRAFRNFNLIYIEYFEDGDTVFACCPYIQVLVDDYFYGFYYSQSDQPRGLKKRWDNELVYEATDSEGTYERESNSSYYWYHTEKILNHWWYFELIMS